MIIADTVLQSLEVKLAGAVTTTELPINASWVDIDQTTFGVSQASRFGGTTNGGTAVTVVAAPTAGKSRQLKSLSIVNEDTVAATVTIQINDNGTKRIIWKSVMSVGDQVEF